jgi:hypothetical protein
MQTILILTVALHVLAGVFWAGSTFVVARTGGAGAERLIGPQLGAAALAILAGGLLWHLTHRYAFQLPEQTLALGIACALVAVAIQGTAAFRSRRRSGAADTAETGRGGLVAASRVAAVLLAVTVICMASARYV